MATQRQPQLGNGSRTPAERAPGSIEVYRPARLGGIELRVGEGIAEPYCRHWHEEFSFCAVTAGAGCLESGGNSFLTPAGSLFLVPPGEVHSNRKPSKPVSFRSIYIGASWFRSAAASLEGHDGRVPDISAGVLTDARTQRGYLHLHHALRTSLSPLRNESLLLSFVVNLLIRHGARPAALPRLSDEHRAVRRVQEYLTANYARSVSLEELARLICLSPYHLHRMFSRATGMPPHAYQLQVRIARARPLLLQNRPIAEEAVATGFADQSHFTRHFKRLMAVTPGEYLRRGKKI